MLAETVSIDGGELVLLLLIFLALAVAWCGMMVLGCVWAVRAGRGSRPALAGWAVVSVLELVPAAGALGSLLTVPALVFVLQVFLFIRARRRLEEAGPMPPGDEPPGVGGDGGPR